MKAEILNKSINKEKKKKGKKRFFWAIVLFNNYSGYLLSE